MSEKTYRRKGSIGRGSKLLGSLSQYRRKKGQECVKSRRSKVNLGRISTNTKPEHQEKGNDRVFAVI